MEEYKISDPKGIEILVELELIEKIKSEYEDVTTSVSHKREIREILVKQFVEEYSKRSIFSKEEIRHIDDSKIAKARWIEEIEEDQLEEER